MAELPDSRNLPSEPKANILLVDNNPANLLSLRSLLEDLGQTLVEARSGEEAIEQVKGNEFAVILLDLPMPGISGFETAAVIRGQKLSRHTPIIFLTADDIDRSQLGEGYALGAVDFLVKPILPVAIQAKVRGFVQLFHDRQQAIQEAEQLRLLIHGTTEYAIFMLDPQGRVLTWNAGAERFKGYKAEEIIGRQFTKFYPQEAIDRGWPAHELKIATREGRFEDEGWRVRKDGSQFWANVVITALRSEYGELRGFSKGTRDLTARKDSEESLRQSEERFRLLVESALDYAIFILDPQGHVASWNAGAERIKQYTADEIIGQHFSKFYPQEALDRAWPAHELQVAADEGRFEDEGWRVRKDGTQFWANVVITALYNEDGQLRGYSKITRDMTERKAAEENSRHLLEEATARRVAEENACLIQEERERLHVTLASIGDAVICTEADGRVMFLNPVAEKLAGWTTAEAANHTLSEVFHIVNEQTRQCVENPALRALKEGIIVALADHTILIARDGKERPIEDSAAPIRDAQGRIVGCVLVFRDVTEHRQAAREIRASEARNRAILNSALDCVITMDHEGKVVEFNPSAEKTFGYRRDDVLGQELAGLIIPESLRQRHRNGMAHFLATGEGPVFGQRLELPALRADGSEFPVELAITRILSDGPPLFTAYVRDISERKEAEAALETSEQSFRQLADAMPQIVWTASAEGDIDFLNRQWKSYTGLLETSGNEGWGQFLHPDDAPQASERWAASLQSGAPFEMDVRLLDWRTQTYYWHLVRTVAVHDESGRVARWFGTATDIHVQKRAEESSRYLAEASAALAGIVDYESTLQKVVNLAVPRFADWSAVDVADEDGSLRRLAVAHQDADKIDLVHKLMREYPPDPQALGGVAAVLRSGAPEIIAEITDEMLVQGAKDDRHLDLIRSLGLKSYICVPLAVSGKSIGVLTFATAESGRRYGDADVATATDLAQRAAVAMENTQLYNALRDTDRRKDEFLATLAHELRNPLAPIRNSLQILRMPRVDADTIERTRDMMERQVHHLVRLVDDLMDVSRVMQGKIELRKERIELASVVARAVETVQPLLDAQGHQLNVRIPNQPLPINVDPVRIAQVIGNLLTNAAKYTEVNGQIWLTAERAGDTAELRVRDNGIGIATAMLPRIFELFLQVDYASTKAQGGLGIGLTLVKNLVEMHNGTVEARSEGLGKGSEFVVRLPVSQEAIEDRRRIASDRSTHTSSPSGLRVLVVDDNQDAALSLAMLLELQGHEVRVAHSGMAALEITKSYVPHAVFLDIGMPGIDGYEVARRMRRQPGLENVVLAALTGWGQQEDRRRTSQAGFDHHFVKPPEPKALESLLATLQHRR